MSCYFQMGDQELWNPSNSLAKVFLGQAEVLSGLVRKDSGLAGVIEDECQVDPSLFVPFVDEVVKVYQDSNNEALRALLKGFASVALVLVDRMGMEVVEIAPEFSEMWATEQEFRARYMPTG
ncbi:DUF6086 family protein [Streptomyces sp. PsTaAH-124]|uniref:DUF6086 family protein n=1 Tax=Streptomyces sp. PsTaAH-124 TaxID=1157638 RepID=UPI000374AACF|nr:DUF6086 family protein [Streptomyces sp. PsTaAH-124]